jgi:hypothetical protein
MRLSSGLILALLMTMLGGLALLAPSGTRTAGIEGRILDDGEPLAGARVRFKGTAICTRTDARGRFRLPHSQSAERVTAWRQGYFIGGSRLSSSPLIHLTRLPAEDNTLYEWVDPTPNPAESLNCGSCHAEIHREWSQSRHARSATGRHFRNLYEGTDWHGNANVGWGLLTQYPDGASVCASCHAPTAPPFVPPQNEGGQRGGLRKVEGVAAFGVHCDYCHKIESVADGTIGLSHGRFNLRLLRPSLGQVSFGPLDDVDRGRESYSPLYHSSLYCASCHEGIVFGVHVYGTFSEWQASPAARQGQQCQDCHMKPTGHMTNFAPGHGGIQRDPFTLANHRFFDGSQEAMLRRAVKAAVDFERRSDSVRARVRLWAEGVGHRLPTGFVDRHLVLVIEGQTGDGRSVPLKVGPKLPALAGDELAGRPGRLYARLLRDFDGHSPVPFWLASPDPAPDTRLIPGKVEEDVFDFPSTLSGLRLRILYRRFWPEVARSKHWPNDDLLVLEQTFPFLPQ